MARWQGLSLDPGATRGITHAFGEAICEADSLQPGIHDSPNRAGQARRDPVVSGTFRLAGDLDQAWPLLRLAERVQIGSKTTHGLGRIRVVPFY